MINFSGHIHSALYDCATFHFFLLGLSFWLLFSYPPPNHWCSWSHSSCSFIHFHGLSLIFHVENSHISDTGSNIIPPQIHNTPWMLPSIISCPHRILVSILQMKMLRLRLKVPQWDGHLAGPGLELLLHVQGRGSRAMTLDFQPLRARHRALVQTQHTRSWDGCPFW